MDRNETLTIDRMDIRSLISFMPRIIVAFIFGALIGLGWQYFPLGQQWISRLESDSGPSFSGDRIGRAETAPLLKICVNTGTLQMSSTEIDPSTILRILNASSTQVRIKALIGADEQQKLLHLVSAWGNVADCVYRQNRSQLCDIDNRALAVDATNAFMRYISQISADDSVKHAEIEEVSQIKDRVVDELKARLRNGELIGSDFGFLPPAAVRRVLVETKPDRNGCTKNQN